MGTSTEYASVQTLAEPAEPVVEDGLAAHTQIHTLVYSEGMYWPDGSFEHARSGYDNVQPDEIVLKTPHPLANVTGDLKQVIHLPQMVLALDTTNKVYVYGMNTNQLVQYQFMVDGGASAIPSDWYAWGGAEYREAAALNTHLASLYPGKTIKELHALGGRTHSSDNTVGFLIEYDDRTIHMVAMTQTRIPTSRTYYSPDPSVITVTGLGDGWVLHKTIALGGSGLVFMKRLGSSAPYKAFMDEFQQYDKDDVSDGNNVRIFGINVHAVAAYYASDAGLASITTTDQYTHQYIGVLKASIASANWANGSTSSAISQLSVDNREPLRLYWAVHHLKELLALGYLPTKTIPLRWSALVLFENDSGDKEWHTINFGPDKISDTYHTRLRRTAQYLLHHGDINGGNSDPTQQVGYWREYPFVNARGGSFWTSGPNGGWVLQSEYTLEEALALAEDATDDVAFVIKAGDGSHNGDRYYFRLADGINSMQDGDASLITYVFETPAYEKFYTLGFPSDRSSMLAHDVFVRLQAVMAAAESLGTGMDDLVFADSMRCSRYDSATSNSTVLQVYVNSTKKAYQLGAGVDMSDVNWMEITPALLDADSYDYMDLKNGPSSSVYGDNSRIHSWLFANGAFENTKLLQFSTSSNGVVMLTEPEPPFELGDVGLSDVHLEYSNASRIAYADGVLTSSATMHALSHTAYALPVYVECEIKTSDFTAGLLLADAMGEPSDIRFHYQGDNTVVWGTTTWGGGMLIVATDGGGGGIEASKSPGSTLIEDKTDSLTEMANYRKFSIYMSHDVITMYINRVEVYHFVRGVTAALFPEWAVSGGSVRLGVYSTHVSQFRNLKVSDRFPP